MRAFVAVLVGISVAVIGPVVFAKSDEKLKFTPIQHGTLVIQTSTATIFVDPVGDAGAFKKFSTPDIILITDIHGDHLSPETVNAIKGKSTKIVAPKAVAEKLESAEIMANGESAVIGGVVIEAIPMYNLTKERLKFHDKGRGNGYVITADERRVYISGDTEDIKEMRELEDIDYAFVCMNLPYTMTVEQAASAVLEMAPKVVFPYHYRGTDGYSDVDKFKELVGKKNKDIDVRLLKWYE